MSKTSLSLALWFLLTPLAVFSQPDCDLKKEDDSIYVYLCDSKISDFKTIKVDLEVPATLSQYAAQVLDIGRYHEWQYKIKNIALLARVSPTELYYYSEVSTPWPTSDRDMVFHLKLWQDSLSKVLYVAMEAIPDFIPEKEGVVRIPQGQSLLTVTPIDKHRVSVHYVIDIDPGGFVPPMIANMFAAQAPWQTYFNFRNEIIRQGEQRITVPFIADY